MDAAHPVGFARVAVHSSTLNSTLTFRADVDGSSM
jgi:hypothetical protein